MQLNPYDCPSSEYIQLIFDSIETHCGAVCKQTSALQHRVYTTNCMCASFVFVCLFLFLCWFRFSIKTHLKSKMCEDEESSTETTQRRCVKTTDRNETEKKIHKKKEKKKHTHEISYKQSKTKNGQQKKKQLSMIFFSLLIRLFSFFYTLHTTNMVGMCDA